MPGVAAKTVGERTRLLFATCLLIAATMIAQPFQAGADEFSFTDPDDIDPASVVDIRSASMGHGRGEQVVHTITTYGRLTPGDLDPDEAVVGIAFSIDNDFSDVEGVAFIFGRGGGFHGVLATAGGVFIANFPVSHPKPKTVRAVIDSRLIDRSSYFWFAFADTEGQGRCCFDAAPDRKWVIHDYRAPAVNGVVTDAVFSGQAISSDHVPVSFHVQDAGIGIAEWRVHSRLTATESWTIADRGTRDGDRTAIVPTTQGGVFDVCVAAVDFAGNVSAENLIRVKVPVDDTSPAFAFGAGWTSTSSEPTDFMGTRTTSSTVGSTLTFTAPAASKVDLVFPGGSSGTAQVSVNGQPTVPLFQSNGFNEPRVTLSVTDGFWLTQPSNEVSIEVTGGTFVVDAILIVPEDLPTLEGRCGLHATRPVPLSPAGRLPAPPDLDLR